MMVLGVGTAAERGLKFVRYMILARILARDQFGLMAIVMVAATMFEAFTEVGVKQSVIQNKRGAERDYLNVAWWFQVVRGLALFVIAFLAAPWISSFYGKPELLRLLQVSFLAILFRGLVSPRAYVLEKKYRFNKVVLLVQGSGVFGSIVAVVLGLMIRSVWALVIGFVAEFAIMCVLSYVFVPIKPTFKINREDLAELFRFARAIFGLPILTIIALQADVLVLGKVVAEDDLGMYFLAVALVQLPIFLFSRIVNPVLLPVFSEKQDDKDSLCRGILQVTKTAATFGMPLVAFMSSCASGILLLAYGPEYVGAAAPLAVLSLLVLAQFHGSIFASAYLAVGQPNLHRRCCVLRAVIIVGLLYPAVVHFGLLGAAGVVVSGSLVAVLMQVFWCRRIVDLKLGAYMRCHLSGLLLALPIILTSVVLWLFRIDHPIYVLGIEAFVFVATFIAGFFTWNRVRLLPATT
ncbi:MAG: oligosaccharide flippase family protein [Phycisphaerae bacterium]|nr:oligosaccharide flippase family protein [Phycisphaerae bacterium]